MELSFSKFEKEDLLLAENVGYIKQNVTINRYIIGRHDLEDIDPINIDIYYKISDGIPDLSEKYLLGSDKYLNYTLDYVFDKEFKRRILKVLKLLK